MNYVQEVINDKVNRLIMQRDKAGLYILMDDGLITNEKLVYAITMIDELDTGWCRLKQLVTRLLKRQFSYNPESYLMDRNYILKDMLVRYVRQYDKIRLYQKTGRCVLFSRKGEKIIEKIYNIKKLKMYNCNEYHLIFYGMVSVVFSLDDISCDELEVKYRGITYTLEEFFNFNNSLMLAKFVDRYISFSNKLMKYNTYDRIKIIEKFKNGI